MSNALTAENIYFEQADFWGNEKDEANQRRVKDTVSIIPPNINTLLDVGCGDGVVLNYLQRMFPRRFSRLMGVDTSREALKHVRTESEVASILALPFSAGAFDAVLCLEVLEHIPYPDFTHAVSELARLSNNTIIISVPNNENLLASHVRCPHCNCNFCPHGHVRTFNSDTMENLVVGFKLDEIAYSGVRPKYPFHTSLANAARRLGLSAAFPKTAICPQCHFRAGEGRAAFQNQKKASNFKRFVPHIRDHRWLIARYTRKAGIQ